jgi:integrase
VLLAPLPVRPLRVAITPFARYCTCQGIDPVEVTRSTFDGYGVYLEEFCLRTRPRGAFLDLRRAWNRAAEQNSPTWPPVRFAVDDRRPRYSRPRSDFPASLKDDVDDMVREVTCRISLSGHRPIRPISAKAREIHLRALASAIVASGRDASSLKSIADLVGIDAVAAALEHILDRLGGKNSVHVHQIAKITCTLARRWVKVPKSHQEQLETIRKNLDPGRHGMTEKNRATLRMFEDPDVVARFDSLPSRVWSRAQAPEDLKVAGAVRLQTAFAVELLTIAPVRIGNLASINIDRHIIDRGHGRHRSVHLFFSRGEVKNGAELEFQLPSSTIALLDRYLRDVRPRLLRAQSPWLFPGEGVDHKCTTLLGDQIADLIETEVGVRVTAHQFRHLAGYLFLKANSGAHEIVRRLLGHRSIATTLNFYAGMEAAEAVRHFDRHVEQRRSQARPTRHRRHGGNA